MSFFSTFVKSFAKTALKGAAVGGIGSVAYDHYQYGPIVPAFLYGITQIDDGNVLAVAVIMAGAYTIKTTGFMIAGAGIAVKFRMLRLGYNIVKEHAKKGNIKI